MKTHFERPVYYDQLNREINIPHSPRRIVSIVPSQTELLFHLGLDDEIVGITKFCIHPANKVKDKIKVGGTKQLNIPLIRELQPDLIIANKEENEQQQVEQLMSFCPVWISDINTIQQARTMIHSLGKILNRSEKADGLCDKIAERFDDLSKLRKSNLRIAYLIWRKPYMVAAKNTFIDNMLQLCGFTNAFDLNRYPEVDNNTLLKANPDVVFLSSEPYPFRQKHIDEFKMLLPNAKVFLVDGEMFSWYGSRLLYAPEYFKRLVGLS